MARRPLRFVRPVSALLVAAIVPLAGCGDDEATEDAAVPEGTFVGKVDGTTAAIALVRDGEQVAGYLCDRADVSAWFVASEVSDGEATLISRSGDDVGTVTFTDDGASGEVTVKGAEGDFTVAAASGHAGLYRGLPAEGAPTRELGTVVLPVGSEVSNSDPASPRLLVSTDPAAAAEAILTIGWIILPDGSQTGTVAELSGPLPEPAVANPFAPGLDYPTVEKVLGEDDVETGAQPVPGEPDLEILAGTTFRIERLGPEILSP